MDKYNNLPYAYSNPTLFMTKFSKIFFTFPLIFILLAPKLASGEPKPEKNWMFAANLLDKTEKPVGIMVNQEICESIAKAMNEWARVPPVTPLVFDCRLPIERA